jgi:hypothetical protein
MPFFMKGPAWMDFMLRRDVAIKNEVLCKFLCHNIVVVHQSHIEFGIAPVFWPEG